MEHHAIVCYLAGVVAAGLAGFIWIREKPSVVRGSLVGCLLLLAAESVLSGRALQTGMELVWLRGRLTAMICVPALLIPFSLEYARGDATVHRMRWRGIRWALVLLPIPLVIWLWTYPDVRDGDLRLGWPDAVIHLVFMASAVLAVSNLEYTLRSAMGVMRWRVKYVVIGLGILFATRLYTSSREILQGRGEEMLLTINGLGLLIGSFLLTLAFRRGGLRSADLYLSQRAMYRSFTVLLAGIYLVGIGILSRLALQFGGDASDLLQPLMVFAALLGLVVLVLSDRVRQRIKRLISRHFRRPEHDYRQVWNRFALQTESILDTRTLCRSAARLVSETFEVLSVSIWTAEPGARQLRLGASTSLSEERARELSRPDMDDAELLAGLKGTDEPFVVDHRAPGWTASLMARNPFSFPKVDPVCVPLRARGDLLGVMMVGDRVNNLDYSLEDLDLLRTIGDQIAANLLTIRMAGQLLEVREFEAFQTMSAFFVHDLKNTSSTLALTLQNMSKHFDDPEFRQDAHRSMEKAVNKMKDLIGRLTVLRRSLELDTRTVHPAELVQGVVSELKDTLPIALQLDLEPVPDIVCDPDQLQTVLTNLILNARDAIGDDGEIHVHTAPVDAGVVIRVRDTGEGMSPEFLENSLFKPFRSTKKQGMGIGLFHSRMIVEAHGGSLHAESRPGLGTTFHVTLPLVSTESFLTTESTEVRRS